MDNSALHVKMTTQLMNNYESGKVSLANVIRQVHYWVKSCAEAYAVIPPNSPVISELQRFDGYRRQLGVDLLSIGSISIRKVEAIGVKSVSKTVLLSCVGNVTVAVQDQAHPRVEKMRNVGLSIYGRMERIVTKLCEALADGKLQLPTFDSHNYNEIAVSVDSGEGLRQVALWRYATDTAEMPTVLLELIQLSDEMTTICAGLDANSPTSEKTE